MVAKRRGKRKDLLFEISDDDVSSDNSNNECSEPNKKIMKTDSKYIESVVNALSNLENEAKKETHSSNKANTEIVDNSGVVCSNVTDIDSSTLFLDDSNNKNTGLAQNLDNDSVLILNESFSVENVDCGINSDENIEESDVKTPNVSYGKGVEVDVEEGELTTGVEKLNIPDSTIQINFSNESVSKLYKNKFLNFLTSCTDLCVINQDNLSITLKKESTKDSNEWVILDETGGYDSILFKNSRFQQKPGDSTLAEQTLSKKKKRKKAKKEKQLFVLDTNPSQHETFTTKYSSKFQIDIKNSKEEEQTKKCTYTQSCFNCNQSHSLKDCPLPRNNAKINLMRHQFKMKKDKQPSRYHLEEEQKYAHLKPGKISDKLREALGLSRSQLPPYIYRMRQIGYPPGWLEEAKFIYSNLALFDSEGRNVRPQNTKKNQGLDPEKIVEYPGFNVPLDNNCKDEYRHFRVPPYSDEYNKEAMIKYYEREYAKHQDNFEVMDMDLDHSSQDVTKKDHKMAARISKLLDMDKDVPSPTLMDLETEKRNLLAALDDSNCKSDDANSDVTIVEQEPPVLEEVMEKPVDREYVSPVTSTPVTLLRNVLSSDFGTPVLKSCCQFSRLPDAGNFTKDVSPVINFENLPNSTGKYEKMSGILKKVRSTLKKYHNIDS